MNKNKKSQNLEEALIEFRHAMTGALKAEAKKQGYSLSHFEVIKFIAEEGNPSMKDIAAELRITPPSASALVDTLFAKRLVTRIQNPKDRRTVRIMLAPKAHVLMSKLFKKKSSVFNKMLSRLNKEDKNDLARILIKCI